MRNAFMCLAASFCLLGIAALRAEEESVSHDKIPQTVMKALLSRFPKARVDKCHRATEDGAVVYDIEFREDSRKCEADIKQDGTYINYEQAIAEKDLPKAVREAIEKRYPKATVKEVMQETEVSGKDEKLSAYEVVLDTADRQETEVRVAPDGKILEDTGAK